MNNRMTLDQAIQHAQEVAEACKGGTSSEQQCAEDHQQLVEWLQELKRFRANEKVSCDVA